MRIINKQLLASWPRTRCERCLTATPCDPHHVFNKGGGHLDIRINLIGLCRECHNRVHDNGQGQFSRNHLLWIVGEREGMTPENIQAVIWMLRRLPKNPTKQRVNTELRSISRAARRVARAILNDFLKRNA